MKYSDGTKPSSWQPEDFTPERRVWLKEALEHYMQDFADRMKEIKKALDGGAPAGAGGDADNDAADVAGGVDQDTRLAEKEALLEELMDIVESLDYARDLHKVGGLPTLLELLASPHASLRWRAAEVVATCVQNNPPVQRWFLDGGALPRLMTLLDDADVDCRVKGLLTLASLIRHFTPALDAFRAQGGLAKLVDALRAGGGDGPRLDVRVARKAAALLAYVFTKQRQDCAAACEEHGAVAALAGALAATKEAADREAVLGALVELGRTPGSWRHVASSAELESQVSALAASYTALASRDAEEYECHTDAVALLGQLQEAMAAVGPPAAAPEAFDDHIEVGSDEADQRQQTTLELKPNRGRDASAQQAVPAAAASGAAGAAAETAAAAAAAAPTSGGSNGLAMMAAPMFDMR